MKQGGVILTLTLTQMRLVAGIIIAGGIMSGINSIVGLRELILHVQNINTDIPDLVQNINDLRSLISTISLAGHYPMQLITLTPNMFEISNYLDSINENLMGFFPSYSPNHFNYDPQVFNILDPSLDNLVEIRRSLMPIVRALR